VGQVQPALWTVVLLQVDLAPQPYSPWALTRSSQRVLLPHAKHLARLGADHCSGSICLTFTGSSAVPNLPGVVLPHVTRSVHCHQNSNATRLSHTAFRDHFLPFRMKSTVCAHVCLCVSTLLGERLEGGFVRSWVWGMSLLFSLFLHCRCWLHDPLQRLEKVDGQLRSRLCSFGFRF